MYKFNIVTTSDQNFAFGPVSGQSFRSTLMNLFVPSVAIQTKSIQEFSERAHYEKIYFSQKTIPKKGMATLY